MSRRRKRRLEAAREELYGKESPQDKQRGFAKESLVLAVGAFLMLAHDLIKEKAYISYATGTGIIPKDEQPVLYWFAMCVYFIAGIAFTRLYLKDKAKITN
ncbi:hypothetical protein R50073_45800 [Maricurvus nonylphenolicus]|uniref:hypothetical protein n=1 Tax=Maricurvus nonylphenolicus TaxID=1008307 RepID=UPI0036F29B1B